VHSVADETERRGEHGACRGGAGVAVPTREEDEGAEEKDDGREGVGEPEADVLLAKGWGEGGTRTE
jgi:hypothetical protein